MFGDFYSNHKKIGKSEYNRIENGTPIVRLSSYYPYYKFGIYCNGGVIQQTYCRNLNVTIYESTSFKVFIAGDNVTIFEYTP